MGEAAARPTRPARARATRLLRRMMGLVLIMLLLVVTRRRRSGFNVVVAYLEIQMIVF